MSQNIMFFKIKTEYNYVSSFICKEGNALDSNNKKTAFLMQLIKNQLPKTFLENLNHHELLLVPGIAASLFINGF